VHTIYALCPPVPLGSGNDGARHRSYAAEMVQDTQCRSLGGQDAPCRLKDGCNDIAGDEFRSV
jgi:hypothetical protein